jgi:3'-phosphoadenosine 5'-phosphosulfate sulfotransferase (PAPS reductase)/FAD synthetase
MSDPFLIEGPALISFSGGRTSGYMLHEIVRAHGGRLPDDVKVAFANTGKEREETLRFVHECGSRWGVRVHWLEWRNAKPCFEEVGYNSASRSGEPFAALIKKKSYLPNVVTRFCTSELKIRAMRDFAQSFGWKRWLNVVGLRYDEGRRVLKALARNEQGKDPWRTAMPLSKAKVTRRDVMAFWARQPFDLRLRPYEGNCDLCFLKGAGKLLALMHEHPGLADWWIEQERIVAPSKSSGGTFVTEYSYAALADQAARQAVFPFLDDEDGEHDTECGLLCA